MSDKPSDNLTQPVTEAWSAHDSEACYYEYIALCREEAACGLPPPAMFRSRRETPP